ncbi:MAG: universal stress protein [Acidimicrobiia bacterium]|nr:universal stress protein [Acidimicrobiia bacterium]NNC91028.1 universal stress protein [Acidimicrobiia bacterium]
MRTFQRILVAVDQQDRAAAPVRLALELAHNTGAELIVLHSISDQELEDSQRLPAPRNYVDFIVEETERDLASLVESISGDEARPDVRVVAKMGDPAEGILAVAEEENCDLCVIGLRRRSRVGKFLLGSNLQDVLMSTDRPVIAVPIPEESTEKAPGES